MLVLRAEGRSHSTYAHTPPSTPTPSPSSDGTIIWPGIRILRSSRPVATTTLAKQTDLTDGLYHRMLRP